MFNKHFVKTLILFSFVIMLGLIGVFVANIVDARSGGSGNSLISTVWCGITSCE